MRRKTPTHARRRSRVAIALAAALALAGATAASAHHGEPATGEAEPGTLGAENTGGAVSTDTELTPVAKDGAAAGWQQIAGSLWRADGTIADLATPGPGLDSPTPYDLDFYGLGFLKPEVAMTAGLSPEDASIRAKTSGFAVGAQCRRSAPSQPVPAEQVGGCERVPVIYRYRDDRDRGLVWEESYPGDTRDDRGGFVAAVAWLGPNDAIAVGGTGTYPRRESERLPSEPDSAAGDAAYAERDAKCLDVGRGAKPGQCQGAGMARVWIFHMDPDSDDPKLKLGFWRELENKPDGQDGDELPDEMRALTTIDASPRPSDCDPGVTTFCAIAGGMRQLWHFYSDNEGNLVTKGFGPELNGGAGMTCTAPTGTTCTVAFRFRVRDIRFAPNWRSGSAGFKPRTANDPLATYAIAVTSGCCSQDRSGDRPALLSLGPSGWDARLGGSLLGTGVNSSVDQVVNDRAEAVDRAFGSRVFNPDSYYALAVFRQQTFGGANPPDGLLAAALRTPGGPSERYIPREPPSRFTLGCDSESCAINRTARPLGIYVPAEGTTLSSLRLVSADGDSRGFTVGAAARAGADGIADWAVGVLRSSGRGVGYNTAFGANRQDWYLAKPQQCVDDEEAVPGASQGTCSFEAYQRKNASRALYELPSYALNAYRVAGEDILGGDEGIGWAVGDHGAILTRGGGVAGVEAPPARSGAKSTPQPLARDAFDEHRPPVTGQPGPVPALAPGTTPTEPGFTEGQLLEDQLGSGGFTSEIVMSRDGREGWALQASAGPPVAYHYDATRWVPCSSFDLVCAGTPSAAEVAALARVPLERDSDPTNDDEFEAVAVTLTGSGTGTKSELYRYSGGRWARDEAFPAPPASTDNSVKGVDVAFTAPDDGWVLRLENKVSGSLNTPAQTWVRLYHFNGERWANCTPSDASGAPSTGSVPADCGDPDPAKRLQIQTPCPSTGQQVAGLAAAGDRVYLFAVRDVGRNNSQNACTAGSDAFAGKHHPVILYHDRVGAWQGGEDNTDPDQNDPASGYDGTYNPTDSGWDPGCVTGSGAGCVATGEAKHQGRIAQLSVAQDADRSFQGWALGTFGGFERESAPAVMMRLSDGRDLLSVASLPREEDEGTVKWRQWTLPDAANDYLRLRPPQALLTLPSEVGQRNAFLFVSGRIGTAHWGVGDKGRPPALALDRERRRWTAIPTPWSVSPPHASLDRTAGGVNAIAPDGRGGFWASVFGGGTFSASPGTSSMHHYTDGAPPPVFAETPDPTAGKARITAMGAGADGTVWLGDENGGVYRYDRLAGWSARVQISGWDPDRVTRHAPVSAIAVDPDGEGVAVGPGGRIADLGAEVKLDLAATIGCDPQAPAPPCGTGNDLLAAAVAPDGSAIVAGKNRTLLWRPRDGEFRPITDPPVPLPLATPISAVSMQTSERAYLLAGRQGSAANRVIRGEISAPGQWSWHFEVGDSAGNADPLTGGTGISDIAIDAEGHGYAVGAGGAIWERTGDGDNPWRRIESDSTADLSAVALPAEGGEGALIGGDGGLLLTLTDHGFGVARHADPFDPVSGSVVSLAFTPGYETGEAEAWAVRQGSVREGSGSELWKTRALLHYPADRADPRLDPSHGLAALPDAPEPIAGEISFAAFGKQDCNGGAGAPVVRATCGPPDGSNITADLVARRIREELAAHPQGEAVPQFALFTGDAVDGPGGRETYAGGTTDRLVRTPLDANLKHRRWVESVADPLAEQSMAMFGAIGGQDLARDLEWCRSAPFARCEKPLQAGAEQLGLQAGLNLPWRAAMAGMPAPWESEQETEGLRFERVGAGALSQRGPDTRTPDLQAGAGGGGAPTASVEGYDLDSGDTHYAVDMVDQASDEKVARIVVVDTSMRSIAASDAQQHPIEAGGQLRWLDEMTCFEGSAEDTDGDVRDCTREEGQQAIVLSNTPTYSYGPISPEETQTDAAAFEAILLKNQVNVVVSGRLGWNGRYWAVAPGVHAPCPGQDYRSDSQAPSLDRPEICGASGVGGTQDVVPDPSQLIQELPEDAKQAAGLAGRGAIPFVVSSTAGGRFNEKAFRGGFATAESGFWRGYSIVHLSPDGDPAKTIVEQRPILDWVGLSASDPAVAPGQRLQLQSYAREAFGMDTAPRYYEIPETQAITHRYHLLLADPREPWRACEADDSSCAAVHAKLSTGVSGLALQQRAAATQDLTPSEGAGENPCEPYLCLPERVGTIDPDTGEVRAGNGKYPDTFALATLSVGEHVAVQPLVFTKSSSFVLSGFAQPPEVPAPGANVTNAPTAPPPPSAPKPPIPQVNTPEPPLPPAVPPIAATQPPEPQPPAPPAPPPPTDQPSPLNLTLAPPSIAIATPTAVIQPPTPPVNPAPPGGARREARQRQAAAQKSGADADQEQGSDSQQMWDGANAPPVSEGTRMTRRDRTRPEPSITALARADQPSAWAQGALYGGGITLAAAILALGWSGVRPTPRRRSNVPAEAWARTGRR